MQEIERIEREARSSPKVQRKVEQVAAATTAPRTEATPPSGAEEEGPSTRASMIVHSDVSSERSSGLEMSEEIERALSREIPLDRVRFF